MALTERLMIPDYVPEEFSLPPKENVDDGLTSFAAWALHEGPHWSENSHAPVESDSPVVEVIQTNVGNVACSIVRFKD